MYKLLNRIAFIITFCLWFIIWLLFVSIDSGNISWEELFASAFIWFFIWLVLKKIFLWKSFIEERLKYFAETLNKIPLSWVLSPWQEKEATKVKRNEHLEEKNIENDSNLVFTEEKQSKTLLSKKDDFNEEKIEKISKKVDEEPSKFALAVKTFFSENLLAKLGWILVFLGVLFLLSLVYSAIWPIWKLIIWFWIWFSIYLAGVLLDKKDYKNEWGILLGIWILINFLVILSWRYLIWDGGSDNLLWEWITFVFLILNTLFAVATSLVYKSRTLLLFSFIFAFINPILVWGTSDTPYTLVWYSLIISFWGLFLSLKQKDIVLAIWVFILANILFLIAPFNSDLQWIIKLFSSAIISISTIFVIYGIDKNQLGKLFFWSYFFLILLLGNWELYIWETTSFISYMITILLYFGIWIYYFLRTSINSLIYLLISPILILLWLGLSWDAINISLSLIIIVFVYLIWFNFIQSKLPNFLRYVFFIVLWIYIFCSNTLLVLDSVSLDFPSFISVLIVSFVFIFTSYYLSTKKDLEFLFTIWTIWWIFMLVPIIQEKFLWSSSSVGVLNSSPENIIQHHLSIVAVILFAISKWILPFINKNFFGENSNVKNLVIWTITGLLFLWYELFVYWNNYFPGISLWFAFALLAIFYFILAFIIINKIWIDKVKEKQNIKNVVFLYIWASISLFTFAIALIFSKSPSIISAVWLFEATILFFFYNRIKEMKIFIFWIIIFLIWLSKFSLLIPTVVQKEFILLIPITLIFISFVLNIKFLNFVKSWGIRVSHDLLNILWIWILWILLLEIIPSTWLGWSTFWIALFLGIMSFIYSYYNSTILKVFYIIWITWFLILQIWEIDSIFWRLDNENLWYLRTLQYISTIIMCFVVFIWNKINSEKHLNIFLNLIFSIYLLIISSIYVYDIFDTTFAITIYWWITASILLFNGIAKDKIKLRTIWLYLILLTSWKIFLFDIWFGIDDAISRVVALILIWTLFIIISTRYTKKYWNNIAGEFNMRNLFGG